MVKCGEYLDRGNLAKAVDCYENLLAKDPNNLEALISLSTIAASRKDFTVSSKYLDRIAKINPKEPKQAQYWYLGARNHFLAENFGLSYLWAETCLQLDPNFGSDLKKLGISSRDLFTPEQIMEESKWGVAAKGLTMVQSMIQYAEEHGAPEKAEQLKAMYGLH